MAEGRQREKKTLESEFRWTAKRVSGLKRQGKGRTEGKASHDAVNLNDSPEDPKTMITLVAIPPIVGGRRHSYVNIRVAPVFFYRSLFHTSQRPHRYRCKIYEVQLIAVSNSRIFLSGGVL